MRDEIQLLTFASMQEYEDEKRWEVALTYCLAPDVDINVIDLAIDQILDFLAFVTSEVAKTDGPRAQREVARAATRLIELIEIKPKAFAASIRYPRPNDT